LLWRSPCGSCARQGADLLPASMRVQCWPGSRMRSMLQSPFLRGIQASLRALNRSSGPRGPGDQDFADVALKKERRCRGRIHRCGPDRGTRARHEIRIFTCCQSCEARVPCKVAGFCYPEPCTGLGLGCVLVI
jgi:hypothetical protein